MWAGYRFGAGNQSIQIPFLRHLGDPALHAHDLLMWTLQDYPSWFFRVLAAVLPRGLDLEPLSFSLHVLTCFAFLSSVFWLAFGWFRRERTAFIAVLLLAGGHHAALAEADLYSPLFTHTWVAMAGGVACLALMAWGRALSACAMAGLLFNLHALTATTVIGLCGLWMLANPRRHGWVRISAGFALMLALASPTLAGLLWQAAAYDENWIRLLRIRSEHHVFPAAWWTAGDPRVPRFAIAVALGAMAFSAFPPPSERRRAIRLFCGGVVVLLAAGVLFTEVAPVTAVMRAQLFRSSSFLVLFAVVSVAHAVDCLWGHASPGRREWGNRAAAALAAVAVGFPCMRPAWPAVLCVSALFLLWRGRLSAVAAAVAGTAFVVAAAAWSTTEFPLLQVPLWPDSGAWPVAAAVAVCLFVLALHSRHSAAWCLAAGSGVMVALFAVLVADLYRRHVPADSPWIRVQRAARDLTPVDAVLLTPPMSSGFRIHSQRAIVGEWRDGTQQFFSPVFAEAWWERMQALRPGLRYDAGGARMLSPGCEWERMTDDQFEALSKRFGATHIVAGSARPLDFMPLYTNSEWALYRAERPPPPLPPAGVTNAALWQAQQRFMAQVVLPNIERNRKTDVRLVLTDRKGRPVSNVRCEARQTRNGFLFGAALPHFSQPAAKADFDCGVVDPRELDRFKEIFNFSIIGYSGKWSCIEPQEGKPEYGELDRYVGWCATNGIAMEFHFITGYPPKWLMAKPQGERQELLLARTRQLFERYGDRVAHWQVVNEKHLLHESPVAFDWIRRNHPAAKLGLSDCAQFHATGSGEANRNQNLGRGLTEIAWLDTKGAKVDFLGYHGHRPFGIWPDVRTMYEALDYCRSKGVAVHITEFGVHLNHPLVGPVRTGHWTQELQAEYYRFFYTVCFSHPAVDAINMWGMGPRTWMGGAGLLDKDYNPKPAFHALKSLITGEWRTRFSGRTGVDGAIAFRGFHGEYELTVTSPASGRPMAASFGLKAGAPVTLRFRWDAASDTLVPAGP
jgi:GH35 family endo-1,4-beta-xylanase